MAKKNNRNVFRLCSCDSVGVELMPILSTNKAQTLAKTYKQIGEETKVIEATEPLTTY